MSKYTTVVLWVLRKALYTAAGTVLAALLAYHNAHTDPATITLVGAISGLGASVVGDLRRAFANDFLQILSGQDPRKDG